MSYWKDKVALVTGGSSGLGRAIVEELTDRGAKTVIAALGGRELETAAEAIRASGHEVTAVPTDVTRQGQAEAAVDEAIRQHDRLDLLVNCAGRSARGLAADTPAEEFAELLDLNFLGTVRCARAAVPIRSHTSVAALKVTILSTSASSSSGGISQPSCACVMTSTIPPTEVATTGRAQAIASSKILGNPLRCKGSSTRSIRL